MTEHEIDIKIAEAFGWRYEQLKSGGCWHNYKYASRFNGPPKYCTDLNAVQEAVQNFDYLKTGSTRWSIYMVKLKAIVARKRHPDSVQFEFDVANATSQQRAEAIIETLNF